MPTIGAPSIAAPTGGDAVLVAFRERLAEPFFLGWGQVADARVINLPQLDWRQRIRREGAPLDGLRQRGLEPGELAVNRAVGDAGLEPLRRHFR